MKINIDQEGRVFRPVSVTLTATTPEELATLQSLFGANKSLPAYLYSLKGHPISRTQQQDLQETFTEIYNQIGYL